MLKFGIYKPSQVTGIQRVWRRGLFAATLLATGSPASKQESLGFEKAIWFLRLSSGITTTTGRNRFSDLNRQVLICLERSFAPDAELEVHEWACSCGITSLEWYSQLRISFPRVRFTASDKSIYLIEARRDSARGSFILEPDCTPIQYVRPPFVVGLGQEQSYFYLINRFVQRSAWHHWEEHLAPELHIPKSWNGSHICRNWISAPPFSLRMLPLIHPDVLQCRSDQFSVEQRSIFSVLPWPVDVIRTMNILNRAYFGEADLRAGADAVFRSLRIGGIWVVGRTVVESPATNDATIFRKGNAGWQILATIGRGSEIEPLLADKLRN
jgi:hypothetical protein